MIKSPAEEMEDNNVQIQGIAVPNDRACKRWLGIGFRIQQQSRHPISSRSTSMAGSKATTKVSIPLSAAATLPNERRILNSKPFNLITGTIQGNIINASWKKFWQQQIHRQPQAAH